MEIKTETTKSWADDKLGLRFELEEDYLHVYEGSQIASVYATTLASLRDFLNAVLPAPEPDREGEKHIPTNCYECPHGIEAQKPDYPRACAPSLVDAVENLIDAIDRGSFRLGVNSYPIARGIIYLTQLSKPIILVA